MRERERQRERAGERSAHVPVMLQLSAVGSLMSVLTVLCGSAGLTAQGNKKI